MKLFKLINKNKYECYNIELSKKYINENILFKIFGTNNKIIKTYGKKMFEVKPISNNTPWTSNVMKIIKKSKIDYVKSISKSIVYLIDNEKEKNILFRLNHDRMTESYNDNLNRESYYNDDKSDNCNYDECIDNINTKFSLNLSESILDYLKSSIYNINQLLFIMLDLAQSDSEHCRHHFFNGNIYLDSQLQKYSLFDLVKKPLKCHMDSKHCLVAFSDNSSVIKGTKVNALVINNKNNQYSTRYFTNHFVLTAETHNFPTGIAPFQGAATGIGGRIRDVQATGIGAQPICSSAGYCVGKLKSEYSYPLNMASPLKILIEASNGASDYGNKFGEPIIIGFTRVFGNYERDRVEWIKPIMFTSGLGTINNEDIKKKKLEKGMLICKIGGPAYKVGLGGGAASSRISDKKNQNLDYNAVQRDDPEMEQKMNRVIRSCIELNPYNPIISIHDQGAGGNGNVLKEIIEDMGAKIDLGKITLGDKSMNNIEIWLSEYQESNALVIHENNLEILQEICTREDVQLDVVGIITGDGKLEIHNKSKTIVKNYPLEFKTNKRRYNINKPKTKLNVFNTNLDIMSCLNLVLQNETVGSKRFLTNKVDRSVTGLIAQQQCVGPLHIPLSNFGLISQSYFKFNGKYSGCAKSIGEQPIVGLIDYKSMVHKTIGEMLTNLMFVVIDKFENISTSANWMWPCPNKYPEEGYKMYYAMNELSKIFIELGIIIDGGKDSLSMAVNHNNNIVKCPGSLVLTSYAFCPDIYKKITPEFKKTDSDIYYLDLSDGEKNMGGSILSYCLDNLYTKPPYINNFSKLKNAFKIVQTLISNNLLLAGHDISDGGLITTILEMSFGSNIGIEIQLNTNDLTRYLFSEGNGIIIESKFNLEKYFKNTGISILKIGKTIEKPLIRIFNNSNLVFEKNIIFLRELWERPSFEIEKRQCIEKIIIEEQEIFKNDKIPKYIVDKNIFKNINNVKSTKYKIGILRDEGSNSDREMGAAFMLNNDRVFDINTNDLIVNEHLLDDFDILVFVGGFTYADVLGSANGWYTVIKNNSKVYNQFQRFYNRDNTYSLGICNGCQLLIKLGWIDNNIKMGKNKSERFESRFSQVQVNYNKTIFTRELEGLNFGIWSAHGEGRFIIDNIKLEELYKNNQIVMNYTDFDCKKTEKYPHNPNGSMDGVAAICSKNGRHLAMMPHPERTFLKWQVPWYPNNLLDKTDYTPWIKLFTLD